MTEPLRVPHGVEEVLYSVARVPGRLPTQETEVLTALPPGGGALRGSQRGFCTSCAAKRGAIFGAFLREEVVEATEQDIQPGMVAAIHTASSDLRWHPHLHCLASRGGWDSDGVWYPVPYIDTHAAEMLFRQKVLALLAGEGLLSDERIELLESWKHGHTGFSYAQRDVMRSR